MEKDLGSEKEISESSLNSSECKERKRKYELTSIVKAKLEDLPEVMEYILKLQSCIEKQKKKIQKFRKKLSKHKEKVRMKTIDTQTEIEDTTPKTLAEEITEAAEQALQKTGFVYEETSGMYYDYNSGYYYNAEYGLYYDGNTGTYLQYNQNTKDYEFHSQVPITKTDESKPKNNKKKEKRKAECHQDDTHANKREKRLNEWDLEEGECSDCSQNTGQYDDYLTNEEDENSSDIDYAKNWPPCMRIIVEETNSTSLKQGSLHILTYEGGTIGREGSHAIIISDINASKHHLRLTFNKEANHYLVSDLGSRNGTFLNGRRLSPSKMESDPTEVPHGSRLQIGGTILLCHVHKGNQTCGYCEPGLIQINDDSDKKDISQMNKSTDYKKQLNKLKKKFGISQADQGKIVPGAGYTDRAQVRRETVGSQNPHEKTQATSLTESIDSENKGFKMLAKMGWKKGQALGKDNQGMLEPVGLVSNPGTSGVGSKEVQVEVDRNKRMIWLKTQERYKQAPMQSENIFDE